MAWRVECAKDGCSARDSVDNIVTLIEQHVDADGWFKCSAGHRAYIRKSFQMQEGGEPWKPFLRGIYKFPVLQAYEPFVFLVSDSESGPVNAVWFSYYKDLRGQGGRLKLGYGPGGPPVVQARDVVDLVEKLHALGCLTDSDLERIR